MEIPLYLAMTAAELHHAKTFPPQTAWMACHFCAYGTGISNIPKALPPESMLILNDRTPICGHDPILVADMLWDAAQNLGCRCILLDFQRKDAPELGTVVQQVLERSSCPVGVSAPYAGEFDCPVLIPPVLPHVLPQEQIAPWNGRELWLEVSAQGTEITVTPEGSQYAPLPRFNPEAAVHTEPELHCHYQITVEEALVRFQLGRTEEDQAALLKDVKSLGVTCAVGLWQEMNR